LKVCKEYDDFCNSEVLEYTLLPQINICEDYAFLENVKLEEQIKKCLNTLSKLIRVK
jgi:hypothetical protein